MSPRRPVPMGAPDEGCSHDDGQTAEHEQGQACVLEPQREDADDGDGCHRGGASRSLKEDGAGGRVAHRLEQDGAKHGDAAVAHVDAARHGEVDPDLVVAQPFEDLRGLPLRTKASAEHLGSGLEHDQLAGLGCESVVMGNFHQRVLFWTRRKE